MVKVKAKYFAFIREKTKTYREELDLPEDSTPMDFVMKVVEKYPSLKGILLTEGGELKKNLLISVNAEVVPRGELKERRLREGDEVVILPPISGG